MKYLWSVPFAFFLTQACTTTSSSVDVDVPAIDISLDQSTPASQTKAGVSITFIKPRVEMKKYENTRLKDTSVLQKAFNSVGEGAKLYSVEKYPVYFPEDQYLTFQVRIKNNLERPLRLNGALLSIEMSEKPLPSYESRIVEPQDIKKSRVRIDDSRASVMAVLAGNSMEKVSKVEDTTWNGVTEEQISEFHRVVILPGKEKEPFDPNISLSFGENPAVGNQSTSLITGAS